MSDATTKYRLVTRSDFDGLVCAVLLKELGILDDIKFVHPKDMQDGKIEITDRDITTNLPYVAGAHLAFDLHHRLPHRLRALRDRTFRQLGAHPQLLAHHSARALPVDRLAAQHRGRRHLQHVIADVDEDRLLEPGRS